MLNSFAGAVLESICLLTGHCLLRISTFGGWKMFEDGGDDLATVLGLFFWGSTVLVAALVVLR